MVLWRVDDFEETPLGKVFIKAADQITKPGLLLLLLGTSGRREPGVRSKLISRYWFASDDVPLKSFDH
jgi:hypothetical protein